MRAPVGALLPVCRLTNSGTSRVPTISEPEYSTSVDSVSDVAEYSGLRVAMLRVPSDALSVVCKLTNSGESWGTGGSDEQEAVAVGVGERVGNPKGCVESEWEDVDGEGEDDGERDREI